MTPTPPPGCPLPAFRTVVMARSRVAAAGFLLLGLALGGLGMGAGLASMESRAARDRTRTLERAAHRHFQNLQSLGRDLAEGWRDGRFDPDRGGGFPAWLDRRLGAIPGVINVLVADGRGRTLLRHTPGGGNPDLLILPEPPQLGGRSVARELDLSGGSRLVMRWDPRHRPWFKLGEAGGRDGWTAPYASLDGHACRTYVFPMHDPRGTLQCLAAVDISLEALPDFLGPRDPSRQERIQILGSGGEALVPGAAEQGPGWPAILARTNPPLAPPVVGRGSGAPAPGPRVVQDRGLLRVSWPIDDPTGLAAGILYEVPLSPAARLGSWAWVGLAALLGLFAAWYAVVRRRLGGLATMMEGLVASPVAAWPGLSRRAGWVQVREWDQLATRWETELREAVQWAGRQGQESWLRGLHLAGRFARRSARRLQLVLAQGEASLERVCEDSHPGRPISVNLLDQLHGLREVVHQGRLLVDGLSSPWSGAPGWPGPVDLSHLLRELSPILQAGLERQGRLRFHTTGQVPMAWGQRSQLALAVLGLAGTIQGETSDACGDLAFVVFRVDSDRVGLRMETNRMPRTGEGAWVGAPGSGLELVVSIIQAHGGRIELNQVTGGGRSFTVELPAAPGPTALAH